MSGGWAEMADAAVVGLILLGSCAALVRALRSGKRGGGAESGQGCGGCALRPYHKPRG